MVIYIMSVQLHGLQPDVGSFMSEILLRAPSQPGWRLTMRDAMLFFFFFFFQRQLSVILAGLQHPRARVRDKTLVTDGAKPNGDCQGWSEAPRSGPKVTSRTRLGFTSLFDSCSSPHQPAAKDTQPTLVTACLSLNLWHLISIVGPVLCTSDFVRLSRPGPRLDQSKSQVTTWPAWSESPFDHCHTCSSAL